MLAVWAWCGFVGWAIGIAYGYWGVPLAFVTGAAIGHTGYRVAMGNHK